MENMIAVMEDRLENMADEDIVDAIDSRLKTIVNTMDKILLRNKEGFEELRRKGMLYGSAKNHYQKNNNSY